MKFQIAVESGEGIESQVRPEDRQPPSRKWNPVKELKDLLELSDVSANDLWNPVKELKVYASRTALWLVQNCGIR